VALSLVEAITLTPMRCSQFLSVHRSNFITRGVDSTLSRLALRYHDFLALCLHHRWRTIGILSAMFAASCFIAFLVPKEAMPAQDQSTVMIQYETPVGSSLAYTENRIAEAEKIIKERKDVRTYFLAAGSFMGGNINSGIMFVSLVPRGERTLSQAEIVNDLREKFSKITDLQAYLIDLSKVGLEGGGMGFPISFSLQGPDLAVLKSESARLTEWMKTEKVAADVNTDFKEGQPELRVYVNREAASARGVTVQEISDTIAASLGGVREGKYTNEDRRYDVRIRLENDARTKTEDLFKLTVRNIYGETVPINDVVKIEAVSSLQTISRRNRERAITLNANPFPGLPEGAALDKIEAHAKETLPKGYRLVPSNAAETGKKMGMDMLIALGLGVLIAYMVLASQFNSFGHPVLILLALPFALSGAFVGLWLTGQSLNMFSFIGLILLMGIVKKNSILLVEFTHQIRERENLSAHEALLKACPIRLRPVLMTSIATITAALPPALALGPGAESRIPMAVTIIGGSAVSMLATLFIVPCAYSLMESFKLWFNRVVLRRTTTAITA
jgi:HAE1 family hydrophobic/amphiphilic exporter-1